MACDSLEETNAGVGVVKALLVVGQVTLEGIMLIPAERFFLSAIGNYSRYFLESLRVTVAKAPSTELGLATTSLQ